MKIKLLKFIDYLVGKPLCYFLPLFKKNKIDNIDILNLLIIRPGGIGDAVLLFPALKILKKNIQGLKIDVLAEKRNAGIFKGCEYIDNLYLYDDFQEFGLIKAVRNNYDAVIDTEQWHRLTAAVSFLTGARIRVGFATNERKEVFTNPVDYSQDDYEAESFLNLASEITGKKHKFNANSPFLDIELPSDFRAFTEYKRKYKNVIGIFSGATVDERKWGTENYSTVADKIMSNGIGVVFLGGGDDKNDSQYFDRVLGEKDYLNLIGKTSLQETTNIISQLDLLISADSGLMHIAYGVGTKTLSFFGAGIQKKWAPRGKKNTIINKTPRCSPCTSFGYTPRCPYNVRCLKEISTEEVFTSAVDNLNN